MTDEYEIGYGKPPKSGQFKKGKSGNPKGKAKGVKNLKTVIEQEALAPITIQEGGKTQTITRMQALIKRMMAKGVGGDTKSAQVLIDLVQQYIPDPDPDASLDVPPTPQELEILENHATFLTMVENGKKSAKSKKGS